MNCTKRERRTCDFQAFSVVLLDGSVLDGLVEEIDDGENELLFLVGHV